MIRHLKAAALTVALLLSLIAAIYIGAFLIAAIGFVLLIALAVWVYSEFLRHAEMAVKEKA